MTQHSKDLGISISALSRRVQRHGWEEALSHEGPQTGFPLSIGRKHPASYLGKSIEEWAAELGISPTTLSCRVNRHGWCDRVLSKGLLVGSNNGPELYKGKNITEWAAELGIHFNTLTKWIKKIGWEAAIDRFVRKHDFGRLRSLANKRGKIHLTSDQSESSLCGFDPDDLDGVDKVDNDWIKQQRRIDDTELCKICLKSALFLIG